MKLIAIAALLGSLTAHGAIITQVNDLTSSQADISISWDAFGLGNDPSVAQPEVGAFIEAVPFRLDQFTSTQNDALSLMIKTPLQAPVMAEVWFLGGTFTDPTLSFANASSQPASVTVEAGGLGLDFYLGGAPAQNVPDSGATIWLAGMGLGIVILFGRRLL